MPKFILTIPNIISLIRLALIPFASLPLLPIFGEHNFSILTIVFISYTIAACTDFLDGYLARKLNQISEWGAYMDPLIDKFLIWALYLALVLTPSMKIPLWTFLIILIRDITVTAMRNYALKHNIVFETSYLAKWKTASQLIAGGAILFFILLTYYLNQQLTTPYPYYLNYWNHTFFINFPAFLVSIIAIFTGITGIDYAYILYKRIKK